MSIKERIYRLCSEQGLTIAKFEKECGFSNGYVSSIRKNIGIEKLDKILKIFPNINRDWLIYGTGEMLRTTEEPITTETKSTEEVEAEEVAVEEFPVIPVSLIDKDNTNIWHEIQENSDQWDKLNIQQLVQECDIVYRVISDVMSPDISIGDILFLKKIPRRKTLNGECYLVDTRSYGILIRYVFVEGDSIKCVAPNRPLQDLIIPQDEIYGIYAIRGKFSCRVTYSEGSSISHQSANNHIAQLINEVAKAGERVDKMIALLESQLLKK